MGGKAGVEPPSVTPVTPDIAYPDFNAMNQQTAEMMNSMSQMPAELPDLPEVERTAPVDWAERQQELNDKVRADYLTDQAKKKTRSSTILTGAALDEEEANTTGSLLQ